jgi:hypothetical protein
MHEINKALHNIGRNPGGPVPEGLAIIEILRTMDAYTAKRLFGCCFIIMLGTACGACALVTAGALVIQKMFNP